MSEEQERYAAMVTRWEASFIAQAREDAYNSVPPETLVRCVSYYLRSRNLGHFSGVRFLDLGCGAGRMILWLAKKGLHATGIDISSTALELAYNALSSEAASDSTLFQRVHFYEGSIVKIPFPDGYFQGIVEANSIQHLLQEDRDHVFAEIRRLLTPGGVFCGYLMGKSCTVYQDRPENPEPGTMVLEGGPSLYHLGSAGVTHFFGKEELEALFAGFQQVDILEVFYQIPREEGKRRGYENYSLQFWNVFVVK